jgi:phage gpG-like protein
MAATLYRLTGTADVRRALRRAGGAPLLDELKGEHKQLAETVMRAASNLAPHRTGRMAASMRPSGTRTMATVRAGGARLRYAGVIHWGTPPSRTVKPMHIEANPFIALAAQRTEPEWSAHYEQALARLMRRIETGA